MSQDIVSVLAPAIMRGVAATGCIVNDRGPRDNVAVAVEVMRDELKAFLFEDRYADARDCVMRHSLPDQTIVGLIVANCAARILEKQAV